MYSDSYGNSSFGYSEYDSDYATESGGVAVLSRSQVKETQQEGYQKNLGLLLGRQLVELHGGQIQIQGTGMPGYRYVITLPRLSPNTAIHN